MMIFKNMSTSAESTFTETIDTEGKHHVALYFHSLAGKGGGAERQLLKLAKALLRYGYMVHIITWDTSDAKSFYAIHEKIKWHKLGFNTGIIDKFRRLGRLATLLRKNKIRTLIGFVMANNKVVILASLLAGVDLVGAERNGPQMYRIKYHILGRFLNFVSLAACKKITIQFDDFRKGYPSFLQSRLVTIHNSISCTPRQAPPRAKEKQHYKMLFVGRFDRIQKQPAMLLDAFAQICGEKQNWSLVMVGDGPDRENLEGQIAKLGLNDKVTLIPSRPDLSNVYKNADLFVIPSLWEDLQMPWQKPWHMDCRRLALRWMACSS